MKEKEQQPALSVEEQICNLRKLGLSIEDEERAFSYLNEVSYFRLIKAFSLGLKKSDGQYKEQTTFEDIIQLYEFNCEFRHLILPLLERVEIDLRCKVANYISIHYGVLGYEDPENFADISYHNEFMLDMMDEIYRNRKTPFVRNFQRNYVDGKIPMYALVELFSFGTLSKFFKNMKPADKKALSKQYHLGYTYLESWVESIAYVRNICAHYGRLYNRRLTKTPILYAQYVGAGVDNRTVFGTMVCLKHLISNKEHWNKFIAQTEALFAAYPLAESRRMGFPENWKMILTADVNMLKELSEKE